MAQVKLTLSSDLQTVELAKKIASEDDMSVSKLFKKLLTDFAKKREKTNPVLEKYKDMKISDEILSLTGILKGKYPDDITVADAKWEYLKEKHGL